MKGAGSVQIASLGINVYLVVCAVLDDRRFLEKNVSSEKGAGLKENVNLKEVANLINCANLTNYVFFNFGINLEIIVSSMVFVTYKK